jgi:long-chain acyl-CoA synthetase
MSLDPASYACLGEMLQDALLQFKPLTALIETDRKNQVRQLSYLDLWRQGGRLAGWLEAHGVGAGSRVAILMQNQPSWIVSAYAAFLRGAVVVPLDYKLEPAEQRALLAHARPSVLVTEAPVWRRLEGADVPIVLVVDGTAPAVVPWEAAVSHDGPPGTLVSRRREDPATIVYSSGTGGRPKGCVLSHGAYLEQYQALAERFPLLEGDRYFSILPTNHAIDFMCGFLGPLFGGATIVHQRTLRPEFILHTLETQGITHMALVPLVLEAFWQALEKRLSETPPARRMVFEGLQALNRALTVTRPRPALSRALLRPVHQAFGGRLRYLFCGGAPVDRQLAERFYALGIPVVIGYGLTEACTVATVQDLKPFRADSVGTPLRGTQVRIAEPDAQGVGEVWLRSPTLMTEYLDDPELTTETLTPDGWLKTGDRGWVDAARHLHLVGRTKNMIVTPGGKNVYPEDVEGVFDGLPCEEICVLGSQVLWSEERLRDEALVAVVRPRSGTGEIELLAAIRAQNHRLADYKRVKGVLLWAEPFPRTASLKVKRGELARHVATRLGRADLRAL